MKLKSILTLLAACAFAVPAFAEEKETPLGKEMEKINKAYKAIGKQADDAAKKDDTLAKIADMKKAAEATLTLEPEMTADIPAADKAKFLADYKAATEAFIKEIDVLKAAVEAGKADEAKKSIDTLKKMKGDGHKKFKKD
jgi:soluble cytochrome b562